MDNGHVCICCLLHILLHTLRGKWKLQPKYETKTRYRHEFEWIKATVCLFLVQG
jgi:hypothetical protein